jgi:WD40 repeat protein/uncharacterized caspase-like protein
MLRFFSFLIFILSSVLAAGSFAQSTAAQPRVDYESHSARINQIRATADFTKIVSVSQDKTVRVWRASDLRQLRVLRLPSDAGEEGAPRALAITKDGKSVWVGGWTGIAWRKQSQLYRFDLNSGKLLETFGAFPDAIETLAIRGEDEQLAVGLTSGGLKVFDLKSKKELLADASYLERVTFLDFSVDGKLATTSQDGCVRVYDSQLKIVFRAEYPPKATAPSAATCLGSELGGIRFSPDGKWIAFGVQNRAEVVLMDAKTLSPTKVISVNDSKQRSLCCIAWSPDSSKLFVNGIYEGEGATPLYRISNAGAGAIERMNIGSQRFTNMLPLSDGGLVFSTNAPSITRVNSAGLKLAETKPPNGDFRFKFNEWALSDDASQISMPLLPEGGQKFRFGLDFDPSSAFFQESELTSNRDAIAKASPPNRSGRVKVETALGFGSYATPTRAGGVSVKLKSFQQIWSWANHDSLDVAALGTEWSILLINAKGEKLWETDVSVPVYQIAISKNGLWVVAAMADGTVRWFKRSTGEEAVGLFLHSEGIDWVAWRSDGYYVSSPRGDEYIGWLVNRGDKTEPDFFRASQFERQLYRPDLVRLALGGAQTKQSGDRSQLSSILSSPRVSIESITSAANGKVNVLINAESSGTDLREVGIYAGGLPLLKTADRSILASESKKLRREFQIDMNAITDGVRVEVETIAAIGSDETYLQDTVLAEQLQARTSRNVAIEKGKLWLIAVGIENFSLTRQGRRINVRDLPNAPKDAELLVAAMQTQRGKTFSEVRVQTLIRKDGFLAPTSKNILSALKQLENVSPEDTVVVFIASHGVASSGRQPEYFLITEDTQASELLNALGATDPIQTGVERSFLTGSDLNAALKRVPGRRILILDTCYSGAAGSGSNPYVLAKRSASSQIAVFSAASGAEEAYESASVAQGAFSQALAEVITHKTGTKSDKFVTLSDALQYVVPQVKANTLKLMEQAEKKEQKVIKITQTPTLYAIPVLRSSVISRP